jgi:pantothenate synthetase
MITVTTCAALKTACATNTIAQTGFLRKPTNGLHEGHISCINACKLAAEKTVVSFFPHEEIINWLYGTTLELPTSWDQTYCTSFCETQGVDIVFIPTFTEVRNTFFAGIQPININNTVDNIILIKGYHEVTGKFFNYIIAMEYLRKQRNLYPKHFNIFSVKDGYKAFARKDYYETELSIPCILVDLVYRPDGIPLSSSLDPVPQADIDIIAQMYNLLNSQTYDQINNLQDFTELTNQLNAFDTKPVKTVRVHSSRIWKEGIIGTNKILLETQIIIDSVPSLMETLVVIKEQIV